MCEAQLGLSVTEIVEFKAKFIMQLFWLFSEIEALAGNDC